MDEDDSKKEVFDMIMNVGNGCDEVGRSTRSLRQIPLIMPFLMRYDNLYPNCVALE